jgi:hypothetical protein
MEQKFTKPSRIAFLLIAAWVVFGLGSGDESESTVPGLTFRLSFESEADILADFLSGSRAYRMVPQGGVSQNLLEARRLAIGEGRFGKGLWIKDGWSVTRGTANESGIDLDLIVATIWGDWRTKPHYWGGGKFYGDRGTISFWVKKDKFFSDPLYPVFIQTGMAWGRKERDVFRVDLEKDGRLKASIRDIFYGYHEVRTESPVWTTGEWQHIAVAYDRAYGISLYHNGRLAASNWGFDSWWQTPLPGLFSPFLPEAMYDEIMFFNYPLSGEQVNSLFAGNALPQQAERDLRLDEPARRRLLDAYVDLEKIELPSLTAGEEVLRLKQAEIADCHDENIPAWWVMDGRYELAWPHPYQLFTFILGDVDFHSTKFTVDLKKGEQPNFISLEGILDGVRIFRGTNDDPGTSLLVDLKGKGSVFYSQKIDLGGEQSLFFPLLKGHGTPPEIRPDPDLNFPLAGDMRIHEIQLWRAENESSSSLHDPPDLTWPLAYRRDLQSLDLRYLDALYKLAGAGHRTLLLGSNAPISSDAARLRLEPFQSFHVFGPDMSPDIAVDKIRLKLPVIPEAESDVLRIEVRDPANPARLWAKAAVKIFFPETGVLQPIELEIDPIDILLASEDRLWLEMKFSRAETLLFEAGAHPQVEVILSRDRERSLAAFAEWEMIPARMQYMKEYNYQPWLFAEEQRDISTLAFPGGPIPTTLSFISGQVQGLKFWTNFGGPYDMWYPPQGVLRHDPRHPVASIFTLLTGERAQTYGGYNRRSFSPTEKYDLPVDIPARAPAWAIWEREMYKKQLRTIHWIADQQRQDGFFWGGYKDDVFIPLGYSGIPLMGDDKSRRTFLREYDGVEELGVFKRGLCNVWPNDYLHVTDILVSRGLMLLYALGDPRVFEREMVTARAYRELTKKNNAERVKAGLPVFVLTPEAAKSDPRLWGEKLIEDYETTQVLWYWGKTPLPNPHRVDDREEAARRMMTVALTYDAAEEYEWTKAMRHTDRQGGAPGRNELIAAALGGRLQGRIEPHPHSIAVSWDDPDPDLCRLVSAADEKTVKVNLFNFKEEPLRVTLRLWRIRKGVYQMVWSEDVDDDGEADPGMPPLRVERLNLDRFSTMTLEVPPRRNVALNLNLIKGANPPADLPDLAINPIQDIQQEGDALRVRIHNIGSGEARNITVEVIDEKDRVIRIKTIRELKPPLDFMPKTEDLMFNLNGVRWSRVVIDRLNRIPEIYEGNNSANRPILETSLGRDKS